MKIRTPILLAALATALSAIACAESNQPAAADISGTWLGSLTVGGAPLRIVFNISGNASAGYTGTVDVPEQGLVAGPLSQVQLAGRQVTIEIADLGATYVGELASNDASIVGSFSQQGIVMRLKVEKQPGPLDYRRPQDPVAPYPYETQDVTFANTDAGITLAGTLTWPRGTGPFKTAVLIAGSGPNTRNEELLNHRPFLVLSDALTRAGIATLRYDKRGVGASTGDYEAATSLDFAADARAAVAFLRAQTRFAVSTVGLVGHSEGGLLAPMVADVDKTVEFLVLLAGPGVPGGEILISQDRAIDAANGVSATVLDANEALSRRLFAVFQMTSDPTELDRQLRAVLTSQGVTGADQNAVVSELSTPWMRFFITYDPAPVLARTTIPVLALNGGLDLQVLPDLNLPPIQAALAAANNQHATVQKIGGLNHLFQHAVTGSPSEYASISETMSPEVLTQVSTWIAGL
jgi:pimeloyl-ACP methyl ester carboxylesterase